MSNAHLAIPEFVLKFPDRNRKVVLSLGALVKVEEKIGKSLFKAVNWQDLGIRDVELVLWAALLDDDPDLTLEGVRSLFTIDTLLPNMDTLRQLVETVMARAMPPADDTEPASTKKKRPKKS